MTDTPTPKPSRATQVAFDMHPQREPDVRPNDPNYQHLWRQLNFVRASLTNDSWPHKVHAFRAVNLLNMQEELQVLEPTDVQTHQLVIGEEYREFSESLETGDLWESIDGALDTIYTLLGYLLHVGLSPMTINALFEEVHASNMTKLGLDGAPIMSELGKVLKGPRYTKPNLPATVDTFS